MLQNVEVTRAGQAWQEASNVFAPGHDIMNWADPSDGRGILQLVEKVVKLLQGLAELSFPVLENFVPAVAYHLRLNLPAAFTQPRALT